MQETAFPILLLLPYTTLCTIINSMKSNRKEHSYSLYLVTGATGYLGSTLVEQLVKAHLPTRALVLHGDALKGMLSECVPLVEGSVDDATSLETFFEGTGKDTCVIHCAGIVSIASGRDERLWNVNVGGTRNILRLCKEHAIGRLIHVSSVHAIPEQPKGTTIRECVSFSPLKVHGQYAKSKAEASRLVLEAAKDGLDACVVHPSGIIGPYDRKMGSITGTIISYCKGKLRMGIEGGYDFVDVRDVAKGIMLTTQKGKKGECYILSGHYASVRMILEQVCGLVKGKRILCCFPLLFAKMVAPLCECIDRLHKRPLFLTPYSVYTMGSNASFSHEKASMVLGWHPREIKETLSDMIAWLSREGRIPPSLPVSFGNLLKNQKVGDKG